MPKGKFSRRSIAETWAELFHQNEEAHRAGAHPWTDEELIRRMQREFPKQANSGWLLRVSSRRGEYNAGTLIRGRGKPKRKSRRYNADGRRLRPFERVGDN